MCQGVRESVRMCLCVFVKNRVPVCERECERKCVYASILERKEEYVLERECLCLRESKYVCV